MSLPWPTLTTEEWERLLRTQRAKDLSYREKLADLLFPISGKANALQFGVTWDEGSHPRDASGRFAGGGGGDAHAPGAKVGHKKDGGEIVVNPVRMSESLQKTVLNEHDPAEIASQIVEDLPGDVTVTWRKVDGPKGARGSIQMTTTREDGFLMARTFVRNADGTLTVHHDHLYILSNQQGYGIGKDLMRDSYETYRQLGVNEVRTFANLDVGSYAWAKFGFKADEPQQLARDLDHTLATRTTLKDLPEPVRADMHKLLVEHRGDPRLPWHVANAVAPDGRKVGKEMLLGQNWMATLSMRDTEATGKLEAYTKKGHA